MPMSYIWYDDNSVTSYPGGRPQFGVEALLLQGVDPELLPSVVPGVLLSDQLASIMPHLEIRGGM